MSAGTGPRAAIGRIGADNVLYAAVSRKREATTNLTLVTEVQAARSSTRCG